MPAVTSASDARTILSRLSGRLFATTTETAVILGCDPRTLRKAIAAGEVPGVQAGSTYRVRVSWIREMAGVPDDSAAA